MNRVRITGLIIKKDGRSAIKIGEVKHLYPRSILDNLGFILKKEPQMCDECLSCSNLSPFDPKKRHLQDRPLCRWSGGEVHELYNNGRIYERCPWPSKRVEKKAPGICDDCEGCEWFATDNKVGCPFSKNVLEVFTRCPRPEMRAERRVELKPCPFCGAVPEQMSAAFDGSRIVYVKHSDNCFIQKRHADCAKIEISYFEDSWNRRTP